MGQTFAAVDLDAHLQSEDGDPVRFAVSGPDFTQPQLSVNIGPDNIVSVSPPSPGWTGSEKLVFTAVEETENRLTALTEETFTIRLPDRPPAIGAIPDQTIRQYCAFESFDLDDFLTELDGDEVAWTLNFPFAGLGPGPPAWSVASAVYEQSMSVTAAVTLRGQAPASGNHLLVAFVADPSQPGGLGEVRGVASPVTVGERDLYFLSVYANDSDETIVFRYYDADNDQVYRIAESLSFSTNALFGDPANPLLLQAGALAYGLDEDNVVTVEVLDGLVHTTGEVLRQVHRRYPAIPVLLRASSEVLPASEAIHCGVHGYLSKPFRPAELDLLLLRLAERQVSHSLQDIDSGLYHPSGFAVLARQQLRAARRTKTEMILLRADVDGQGLEQTERAIGDLGRVVQRTFRDADMAGRVDGTDCGVLLVNAGVEQTDIALRRLQRNLAVHNARAGEGQRLQVRVGAAHFDPGRPCSFEELVAAADLAGTAVGPRDTGM